jgi:flagellar basal body rod protein FlgG
VQRLRGSWEKTTQSRFSIIAAESAQLIQAQKLPQISAHELLLTSKCPAERTSQGDLKSGTDFMLPGLYSAATAIDSSTRRHEVAAENLANIQMPGYRRKLVANTTFDTLFPAKRPTINNTMSSELLGTATTRPLHDFHQGHLEDTGNPLNFALQGDGFFTIKGADGPLYTRNGSFYVDTNRQLVTIDMLPVMGRGGPIIVPDMISTENIEVSADGRLLSNDQEFGQFSIVGFADNNVLTAVGSSLFSAPGDVVPQPGTAVVQQGQLELANTSAIDEMLQLIEGSRHLDAAQKALHTIAESVQKRIGLR